MELKPIMHQHSNLTAEEGLIIKQDGMGAQLLGMLCAQVDRRRKALLNQLFASKTVRVAV